jgi:amino acid adenylation domain-containing protein
MVDESSDAGATAPLTPAQRRVWFLHRLDPGAGVYHEIALWRIDGAVDAVALRAALEAVTARQPMMRTRFVVRDGTPMQVVDPAPPLDFECVDLGAGGDEDARLEDAVRERALQPFDLAAKPPIRWTLYTLGPGRHAFLRSWHHILGDAQSAKAMNDDIGRAYAAVLAGAPAALPPLEVDYLEHTRRQAVALATPAAAADLAFWVGRLAGAPTLSLPTDFRRPALQSFHGGRVPMAFARDDVDVRAFAHACGTTTFTMLLTGWAALLSRLSGDTDLVIGIPAAGRPGSEFDEVVGFFTTTMACRIDLGGTPSTREAARRVHLRVREAVDHQHTPIETIVDALRVPRDASRNPLFQVMFGLRRQALGQLALAGATVRRTEFALDHARFDLTVNFIDAAGGIEGYLEYGADLFERSTIERMAAQYATLIRAMVAAPDAPIATLPLMDADTRERMLGGARGAATAEPGEATIPRRFASQAALAPDAVAVGATTYSQLDAASSLLAATLRARGVRRGSFVAVARARAADIATAWLAVTKAGAAYVPIDPEVPDERLATMLDGANVMHAIADEAIAPRLARPGVAVVCPERDAQQPGGDPPPLPDDPSPDDPAYAMFTSGSSGRPKGVVVTHRSVVALACGSDYLRVGPGDAVAQLANPAFDASTFEFWGALLNGARVVPLARSTVIAPRAFAAALASEKVTALFVTTALFNAVAREIPEAFGACDSVLFGGEAAEPRWVAAVLRSRPPRRLVHVYGPTETTTFATWHEVRSVDERASTVPIGRAIAQAEVFVLRDDGEPCAPGEPGEIVIGGQGVALGYLGAAERDAARFVVAPVGELPPRRLFRTGDRARRRDDGAIEFLGRDDGQVKVRGHRIELAEIEAAIARVPGVRDVVALVQGDSSDTRSIVAYVVPADPKAAPPEGLRRALRRVLPPYMLPADVAWIPALPLNANGKVDRNALPSVDRTKLENAGVRIEPRDALEADLARHWQVALGTRDFGVLDHFFDLGGHSLLAARLVDGYERETGIRIPLTAMFVDDTIAGLAKAIREGSLADHTEVLALNERGSRVPLVYVHGDFYGGGFHSHVLARLLGPDQPVYLVHPHGLDHGTVPPTIEDMADERLVALRALRPHGPYVVGGHCNGAYVAFELARRLLAEGEAVPAVIVVDAAPPARSPTTDPQDVHAMAALITAAMSPPKDRRTDLAHGLFRAMKRYRGGRLDTRLVLVRAEGSLASAFDDEWATFASSFERHVLSGDHVTLVMNQDGEPFAAAISGGLDGVTPGGCRSPR